MNQLDQLKRYTTGVADTGNFKHLAQFAAQAATTNPSLILKAVQQPTYAPPLQETVAATWEGIRAAELLQREGVRAFAADAIKLDRLIKSLIEGSIESSTESLTPEPKP